MLKYAVIKETSGAARLFYGAGMQTIKIKNAADFEKFDFFRNLPFSECVTVLGFFDGVHIAHRELIAKAKSIAANKNIFGDCIIREGTRAIAGYAFDDCADLQSHF